MTDIPIIFSAPMIRALLDGRKTMTRRLAWQTADAVKLSERFKWRLIGDQYHRASPWQKVKPGDRLWVREAWADDAEAQWEAPDGRGTYYRADPEAEETRQDNLGCGIPHVWKPSIHMKRWRSRLTLVVTATKIERLAQISEADAEAEGADRYHSVKWAAGDPGCMQDVYRRNFAALWRSLHGEQSWDANPEVVAISFSVHRCNIDQLEKEAS